METAQATTTYLPPPVIEYPGKWLVSVGEGGPTEVFLFFDRVEIGRFRENRQVPGVLLVNDQTVSSHHCIITQEPDGRCFVQDTSRNGTRIDGRRLSPNLRTEFEVGQVLSIGRGLQLRLDGSPPSEYSCDPTTTDTFNMAGTTAATILVGDIRNYTNMVRLADPVAVQESVNRVFSRLEQEVEALGGTLKEFQGDALFAFWEKNDFDCHACQACKAALHLEQLARRLSSDPSIWSVSGFPLEMDFALTSGLVTISGYGSEGALGLSMVGEAVVLAFRIEKLANKKTGPIVACSLTKQMAEKEFKFKDIGKHKAKGFEREHRLYALKKERR